jgi:carbonic anhydrase/acetyltransferase-like protein (isoleucine patch superfamily)
MTLYTLADLTPTLPADGSHWIAPGAHVIGDVVLGASVSVWFGAVLRGDSATLTIGEGSNIQDLSMVHADPGFPTTLGRDVTIGHKAIIHGCSIGDNSMIGMGATVMNGAKIGKNCLIGAGALVPQGKEIPDRSMVMGVPGKVVRQLSDAEIAGLTTSALHYQETSDRYRTDLRPLD